MGDSPSAGNFDDETLSWDSQSWDSLSWDDSYAIAQALREAHPDVNLEEVSLGMIYEWTIALSRFEDDRELANEAILAAIYQEWFEEVNPL